MFNHFPVTRFLPFLLAAALAGCGGNSEPTSVIGGVATDREAKDLMEMELGEFVITHRPQPEDVTLYVSFQLLALVPTGRESRLTDQLKDRKQRMREQVIALVQGTPAGQLADPNWAYMKSEMVTAINKSLRSTLVEGVVFTDFSVERG